MLRAAMVCAALSGPALAETIQSATFVDPTDRYAHGVLGDAIEWGGLQITTDGLDPDQLTTDAVQRQVTYEIQLPLDRVFEDLTPRLADLDGDGGAEVIVVESQANTGAQLAIYNESGKIAATPHIGTRNRWLAPIGAADLDGDGKVEIAYIDRPHLAKTLRIWRYEGETLTEIAAAPALSNHRIGEDFISGGLRDCGAGPEMITANANWTQVMATVLVDGQLQSTAIGPFTGPASFDAALNCQ